METDGSSQLVSDYERPPMLKNESLTEDTSIDFPRKSLNAVPFLVYTAKVVAP